MLRPIHVQMILRDITIAEITLKLKHRELPHLLSPFIDMLIYQLS